MMKNVLRMAPKQSREGRPKVRTGCITCKKRKVKCDEKRPTCDRCLVKKRQCQYVIAAPVVRPTRPKTVQHKPSPVPSVQLAPNRQRPLLPRAPSTSFPGSDKDHMMFQLFRDQIATDLGGTFGMRVFSITVLRECHENDIIRNLVYSIAGLSKVLHTTTRQYRNTEYQYALMHQSRALAGLRKVMTKGLSQIRLAVVAAALLYVYEGFQGRYETAKQQVVSGEKLVQVWRAPRAKSDTALSEVDDELLDVFPRLSVSLAGYATINPHCGPFFPDDDAPIGFVQYPEHWNESNIVRMDALRLLHSLLRFMRRIDRIKRAAPSGFVMPASAYEEAEFLRIMMRDWLEGFLRIVQGCATQHSVFSLFHVGFMHCRIYLTAGLSFYECANDEFLDEWKTIVTESRIALEAEPLRLEGYTKMCCSMEMMMPLFTTGTRCRNRAVREEALRLIREYPRKQGLFDSVVLAKVVQWVVTLETEGLAYDAFIPEEKRIRLHTLMWDPLDDGIHIECDQGSPEGVLKEHRAVL